MARMRRCLLAGAALILPASLAHANPASAAADCRPVTQAAGFDLLVDVSDSARPYRLVCANGRLTAVPVGEGAADAGPPSEGDAPAALDGAAAESATGRNAAGVAGQPPAATITEAVAEALTGTAKALAPFAMRGDPDAEKRGVSAAAAAPGGTMIAPGAAKDGARLDATAGATAPETGEGPAEAATEMVRVPAPIVSAARRAVPGAEFKSVDLSRNGASTIYGLAGENDAGRAVAVDVDQSGTLLRVDRQIRQSEVPEEILTLTEAALPGARIDKAILSIRKNLQSFFIFTGTSAAARPFEIEVRSDGRSFAFIDPQ